MGGTTDGEALVGLEGVECVSVVSEAGLEDGFQVGTEIHVVGWDVAG